MDNLSHSLAGLVAGELLHRRLPAEPEPARQQTRHRLLLVACLLASSFPDLDLVLTPLLPQPLGYLLHHRGHTHTVLYALPQALLLCALIWALWPGARALLRVSRTARMGLAGAMAAGFGLHLAMDFLNSYGLHPFHPIDSRWLYGDLVFIIEPVFWIALGVPLITLVRRAWLRATLLGLLVAVLAYFSAAGHLHWASLLGLYALGALLTIIAQRSRTGPPNSPRDAAGLIAGIGALLLFITLQAWTSQQVASRIETALNAMDPASTVLDSARTAFPANPVCWNFVSIEADEAGDRFRLRRGVLSLAPEWMPVTHCPPVLAERAFQQPVDAALALLSEHGGTLSALRALHRDNCHLEAWMRFARAPQVEQGVATDLRYARPQSTNFTRMDLAEFAGKACPHGVPQWGFPRSDLLGLTQ